MFCTSKQIWFDEKMFRFTGCPEKTSPFWGLQPFNKGWFFVEHSVENWHLCWFKAATKFDQPGFCDLKICANFGLWVEYLTHGWVFVKIVMMPLSTLMDSESVNTKKPCCKSKKKCLCPCRTLSANGSCWDEINLHKSNLWPFKQNSFHPRIR